jgi:hypothetical protein
VSGGKKRPRHPGCGGVLVLAADMTTTCRKCGLQTLPGPPPPSPLRAHALPSPAGLPLLPPAPRDRETEDAETAEERPSGVVALQGARCAADLKRVLTLLGAPSPEERAVALRRLRDLQDANRQEAFDLGLVAGMLGATPRPKSAVLEGELVEEAR